MNRATYRDFAGPGSVADEEVRWAPVRSAKPTGRTEKDVPAGRADLAALERRLKQPLAIEHPPIDCGW